MLPMSSENVAEAPQVLVMRASLVDGDSGVHRLRSRLRWIQAASVTVA